MSQTSPMLHMVCGKIASGKSTLCATHGASPGKIVISEDDWLGTSFADQMKDGADYLRCSAKLRTAMAPHVTALLNAGLTVVPDLAANTVAQREWMLDVVRACGTEHQLHYLDVTDEICLERLRARNADGKHAIAETDEQFRRFTALLVPPTEDEGYNIVHN